MDPMTRWTELQHQRRSGTTGGFRAPNRLRSRGACDPRACIHRARGGCYIAGCACPNGERGCRSYKTHTTWSKQSTPQPPRGPADRRADSPSGGLYEVRMSARNFRAHDAPATRRRSEITKSGRRAAASKISGCLSTIWQCNRTLDLFCAMGTIGVHLACLDAPSQTFLALRRWIWL